PGAPRRTRSGSSSHARAPASSTTRSGCCRPSARSWRFCRVTDMAVAVLFSLQVAGGVTVGEGDLPAVLDAAGNKISPDRLRGRLVLLATGQPVAYVEDDDLEFTVQQVLEALPELSAGTPSGIGFSEAPGRVEFTPVGGNVRVAGEYFKPLTAP